MNFARAVLAALIGLTTALTLILAFAPPGNRFDLVLVLAVGVFGSLAIMLGSGTIHLPSSPQPQKPISVEDAKPARDDKNFPRLVE